MKFKVGGLTPEEDAERFRTARTAAGPDFVLCADANQGWTPAEAVRFARLVEDLDLHWFEEPCTLVERPAGDARRPLRGRRPRLRGPERVLRRRVPRPHGRGRDRRLQLRLLVVGRPDGVASRRRSRRRPSTSRWRTTRSPRSPPTCSPPSRTARSSRCSARRATRSGGTSSPTGLRSSTGWMALPSAPGLGWELDARLHRGVPDPASPVTAPASPPRLGEGLAGNGVLVTGAVGGIGSAVAHAFAAAGARVAALDREEAEARALAASLPGEGHIGIGADLADVARHDDAGRGRRGRGRPARRARPSRGAAATPGGHPRRRRARLGRTDGRQPEGDVLPRPRLRGASPLRRARRARS